MKLSKVFIIILCVITFSSFIYLIGCSPAETTTGKLAYQQKDWEKAEKELKKGLAIDKNDAEAWYMLAYSQVELSKFDEATKSFENARKLTNTYDNLIKNYWIDKYNAGIQDFNSGTKALGGKDTELANKYFSNAINYFTACTSIIPDSITAYQIIADSYTYMGQPDKALQIYTDILDKSKSKEDAVMIAKIMYQSGIKARQTEDYEKSIEIFKQIIGINYLPKDNQYYESSLFNIGFSNYQIAVKMASDNKGDYKPYLNETVKYLEQVASTSKNKELLSDTYEILYNAYDALGQKEKAEDSLKKKNELGQ